jgi:hypothetical protein
MRNKFLFSVLLMLAFFASGSFAYPPSQPGDHTCTADLESMVEYCEDYCARMAGEICVLCETSVSEKGILDACLCQNSNREPRNFYNITCDISVLDHPLPVQNITQNATKNETAPPITTKPISKIPTENKSNATTIAPKQNTTASQDSGNAACLGPAAIAFIVSLAILGRKRINK